MPVTIQDAKNNVDKITKRATKLDKALAKGEKIGYMDGVKIARKSGKVTKILKKSAADAKAVPSVSDADAKVVSDKVDLVLPPTFNGLDKIVGLQPHFDKLKIAGLVKINLKKMSAAASEFSQAMIDRAPNAELKAKGEKDKINVDAAFAKALQAYSNSTGGEDKEAEIEKEEGADSDED